jgi:hypothetical protein
MFFFSAMAFGWRDTWLFWCFFSMAVFFGDLAFKTGRELIPIRRGAGPSPFWRRVTRFGSIAFFLTVVAVVLLLKGPAGDAWYGLLTVLLVSIHFWTRVFWEDYCDYSREES